MGYQGGNNNSSEKLGRVVGRTEPVFFSEPHNRLKCKTELPEYA